LYTFSKIFSVVLVLLGLQACTWVKATEAGAKVVVSDGAGVSNCERKGEVESALKSRVGAFERNATKVAGELEILARNEAAKMGGDTVVAESNVRDGKQTFGVYRCRS
jgi:prefoldin subunit 5